MIDGNATYDEIYAQCIRDGCTEKMARMLAERRGPGLKTGKEFVRGWNSEDEFHGDAGMRESYQRAARAAGVSTSGRRFMKSLARYPMDPEAWVDGASDVKRICEKNNWSCGGAVDVKQVRDATPPASVDVAPDIVNDAYEVAVADDPGLVERPAAEVKAEIKDKITPHWKKKSTT